MKVLRHNRNATANRLHVIAAIPVDAKPLTVITCVRCRDTIRVCVGSVAWDKSHPGLWVPSAVVSDDVVCG